MASPFIGQITYFAGNFAPRGYAFCNGQLLPINQNQALFAILGVTYGGDGSTNFALPDLRGRVPIHSGSSQGPGVSNYSLGQKSGTESVTLTTQQLPPHNHTGSGTLSANTAKGTTDTPTDGYQLSRGVDGDDDPNARPFIYGPAGTTGQVALAGISVTTGNTGNGQPAGHPALSRAQCHHRDPGRLPLAQLTRIDRLSGPPSRRPLFASVEDRLVIIAGARTRCRGRRSEMDRHGVERIRTERIVTLNQERRGIAAEDQDERRAIHSRVILERIGLDQRQLDRIGIAFRNEHVIDMRREIFKNEHGQRDVFGHAMTVRAPPNRSSDPFVDNAPSHVFELAFRDMAPALTLREETTDDADFLAGLFIACSPLATMLPPAMLRHQAVIQQAAYADAFPGAMRRIVVVSGVPIARLLVEWEHATTHCVDIAVLPDHRATRAGSLLLEAWLAVADARGLVARLSAQPDNPAMRLYARLGFVADAEEEPSPVVTMRRAAATPVGECRTQTPSDPTAS